MRGRYFVQRVGRGGKVLGSKRVSAIVVTMIAVVCLFVFVFARYLAHKQYAAEVATTDADTGGTIENSADAAASQVLAPRSSPPVATPSGALVDTASEPPGSTERIDVSKLMDQWYRAQAEAWVAEQLAAIENESPMDSIDSLLGGHLVPGFADRSIFSDMEADGAEFAEELAKDPRIARILAYAAEGENQRAEVLARVESQIQAFCALPLKYDPSYPDGTLTGATATLALAYPYLIAELDSTVSRLSALVQMYEYDQELNRTIFNEPDIPDDMLFSGPLTRTIVYASETVLDRLVENERVIEDLSETQREALTSYAAYQHLGVDEAVAYFTENRELMASLGVDVDYALANADIQETMRGYRMYTDPTGLFRAYGVLSETLTHDQALVLFAEWVASGSRPSEFEGWN